MNGTACPVCGDQFEDVRGVRDHAWDVHDACHHCSEEFGDRETLYSHWLEVHEGDLSRESRKRAERAVGDLTVCPCCGDRLPSESAVRDHAWNAHGACHLCGEPFDARETLHRHRLASHGDALTRDVRKQAVAAVGEPTFRDRLTEQGPAEAVADTRVSRRHVLGGVVASSGVIGAVVAGGVPGGTTADSADGGTPQSDGGSSSDASDRGTGTADGGGSSLQNHVVTEGLATQPTLGPPPGTAKGTIIAFEDPSCPSCARFERTTFPKLKSKLIDPGHVSFVFRPIPVIEPWGQSATHLLEAVQDRDESEFWGLKSFYYGNQQRLDRDNVYPETRSYLAEKTDLDADAVLAKAKEGTYRAEIKANVQVAKKAGVRGTPGFFLFDSGSFTTKVVGPQSYSVFTSALGV